MIDRSPDAVTTAERPENADISYQVNYLKTNENARRDNSKNVNFMKIWQETPKIEKGAGKFCHARVICIHLSFPPTLFKLSIFYFSPPLTPKKIGVDPMSISPDNPISSVHKHGSCKKVANKVAKW